MTEAILLVGGKGTRLRPLTVHTPKPMVPAAGVPFLTHQLARARAAGVEHIVLATSYLAEVFEPYFGDGSALGLHLEYVTEEEPLGTGGAIRNVASRLHSGPDDPVLIFNGDILTGLDIRALVDTPPRRRRRRLPAPDPGRRTRAPSAWSPRTTTGRVTAFLEKPQTPEEIVTDQINAGAYVFNRSVIDTIPAGPPGLGRTRDLPRPARRRRPPPGHGRLHVLARPRHPAGLRPRLRRPGPRPRPVPGRPGPLRRPPGPGDGRRSPPTPSSPAARSSARGAVIGAGARIDGSAVLDGAVVEPGAVDPRLADRRAAPASAPARSSTARSSATARVVGADNELRDGVRVWCDARHPGGRGALLLGPVGRRRGGSRGVDVPPGGGTAAQAPPGQPRTGAGVAPRACGVRRAHTRRPRARHPYLDRRLRPYDLRPHLCACCGAAPPTPLPRSAGRRGLARHRTPDGPGTLRIARPPRPRGRVEAEAWGAGRRLAARPPPRAARRVDDDPRAFVAAPPPGPRGAPPPPGLRLPRTGLVLESLIPSVLEQKVTTRRGVPRLAAACVQRHGEPAPGPQRRGCTYAGRRAAGRCIPSWEWHRAGVDDKRSATILRAARVARRMEEAARDGASTAATHRLQLIPGIGPWTAAETAPAQQRRPRRDHRRRPASAEHRRLRAHRAPRTPTTRGCWNSSPPTRASGTARPG